MHIRNCQIKDHAQMAAFPLKETVSHQCKTNVSYIVVGSLTLRYYCVLPFVQGDKLRVSPFNYMRVEMT